MTNSWFRFYGEVLNDPKVQKLTTELFKIWVNTLCVACNNNGTLPSLEDCSFALRMPFHETKTAFQELEKQELLVTDGETFQFKSWKKRQYKSDVSTDRVKEFRKRKRNVSETPSEQNRTDTEQSNTHTPISELAFDKFTDEQKKYFQDKAPDVDIPDLIDTMKNWCAAKGKRYENYHRALQDWAKKEQAKINLTKKRGKNETTGRNYQNTNGNYGGRKSQSERIFDGINRVAEKYSGS